MREVIILRGIPGSGKSTYAQQLVNKEYHYWNRVFSADNYFIRPDGVYDWNSKLLGNAHDWCYENYCDYLEGLTKNIIVIDNTNILPKHYKKYTSNAALFDYSVEFKVFRHNPSEESIDEYITKCHQRCVHGVPYETIDRMYRQLLQTLE